MLMKVYDLQAVFKMVPAEAVRLIKTGKSVLEGWHNTYMQVREKIEVSGRDARWEFSKPMLFERTNYMAEICSDLSEMVEIVDDFHKFLGPELKAVTGDSQVCLFLHQLLTERHTDMLHLYSSPECLICSDCLSWG